MKNIGGLDRKIRMGIGAILIAAGLVPALVGIIPNSISHWAIMGLGLISFATGYFNFCPAYRLLGINSCDIKKS